MVVSFSKKNPNFSKQNIKDIVDSSTHGFMANHDFHKVIVIGDIKMGSSGKYQIQLKLQKHGETKKTPLSPVDICFQIYEMRKTKKGKYIAGKCIKPPSDKDGVAKALSGIVLDNLSPTFLSDDGKILVYGCY